LQNIRPESQSTFSRADEEYIHSWIQALKKDKNEIFRAASAASAATDYVLGRKCEKAEEATVIEPSHVDRVAVSRASDVRYR
jgi:antirestriction protein ArdC